MNNEANKKQFTFYLKKNYERKSSYLRRSIYLGNYGQWFGSWIWEKIIIQHINPLSSDEYFFFKIPNISRIFERKLDLRNTRKDILNVPPPPKKNGRILFGAIVKFRS